MTDLTFAHELIDKLDGWVNELARPLMPPRKLSVGEHYVRLEFRQHLPHSVMIGKLVRAVSGLRAAMVLADIGFITESGALLRMVSGFCTEVTAIGEALNRGGKPPKAVEEFVKQYFQPRALTPEAYAAAERTRYISRDELMKAEVRMSEGTEIDGEKLRMLHQFLNMAFDSYVHGAYETCMELCDPSTGLFHMGGHPDPATRHLHGEAVALKLHEVVVAVELTAAMTSTASVFNAAREARREMDRREPWQNGASSGLT